MPRLETGSPQFTYIQGLAQLASHDHFVKKKSAKSWTVEGTISTQDLLNHLAFGPSVSVLPVVDAGTQIGVLDLGNHDNRLSFSQVLSVASRLSQQLKRRGLLHLGFRSRGGNGVHIWLTWSRPQPVQAVRRLLSDILASNDHKEGSRGLSSATIEIFPKKGEHGGAISLPLSFSSVLLCDDCNALMDDPDWEKVLDLRLNKIDLPQLPTVTQRGHNLSRALSAYSYHAVEEAIKFLPSDDRGLWIDCDLALKSAFGSEGFELWLRWSENSEKFVSEDDCRRVWDGMRPNGSIT